MTSSLFSGLDSLIGLAEHGVDVKPTLLRVLTDLYVQKPTHTPGEERQYVELALRLIDAVDAPTRRIITQKLASYPTAPAAVLERLRREDAAARNQGERLAGQSDTAAAIAPASQRPSKATAATISEHFFAASPAERVAILADLGKPGAFAPAERPANAGEVSRNLEIAVLAGRPGDFIHQLERPLAISRSLAQRIVNDMSGEPLVVAAKALAMPIDMLQRILLFVNPAIGQSVQRVYALSALYDDISADAALRLLACWREAEPLTADMARAVPTGARPSRFMPAFRRIGIEASRREDSAEPRSADDIVKKMAP